MSIQIHPDEEVKIMSNGVCWKRMKFSKLIGDYKEEVIEELAERCKDMIYSKAREIVEIAFDTLKDEEVDGIDIIDIQYSVDFVVNDVVQIIGSIKRKKRKRGKNDDS